MGNVKTFEEYEVPSRQVLSLWEPFVVREAERKLNEQACLETLNGEQLRIKAALARLEQAVAERGFDMAPPRCVLRDERIYASCGEQSGVYVHGSLQISVEILEHLVAACECSPQPVSQAQSALAELLELE